MKHVIGAFSNRQEAERAVDALEGAGFTDREISLITKGEGKDQQGGQQRGGRADSVTDGSTWGAGIGGAAGLMASAGLLAIPGIGPILAAGPIAATLAGAATGGLAGGLADYGIPAAQTQKYEKDIREGQSVVTVSCEDDGRRQKARNILQESGAHDLEVSS